jgi:predicted DNA-binding transcriptional regulator AlpA
VSRPTTATAAQLRLAKKAAALQAASEQTGIPATLIERKLRHLARATLIAAALSDRQHAETRGNGARAPGALLLLSKDDIVSITGVSHPTIWKWMCDGLFPRSHVVGGKAMWRSDEVKAWLDALPITTLKGDAEKQEEEIAAA